MLIVLFVVLYAVPCRVACCLVLVLCCGFEWLVGFGLGCIVVAIWFGVFLCLCGWLVVWAVFGGYLIARLLRIVCGFA